jgi:hypothetical protein
VIEDLLKGLWSSLATDPTLKSKLSTYTPPGGTAVPAIFLNLGPRNAAMPYIVMSGDTNVEETPATERYACAVDIFAKSPSPASVLGIGQRIEELWDFKTPAISKVTLLGIMRQNKALVPDDEEDIQHLHLTFIVRYCRNDLYD